MRHRSSQTYQDHYVPRHIHQDTTAIFLQEQPQKDLLREATGLRRTIDKRRPRNLPEPMRLELVHDAYLQSLKEQETRYAKEITRIKKLRKVVPISLREQRDAAERKHKAAYGRLYASSLATYQRNWASIQPSLDVERCFLPPPSKVPDTNLPLRPLICERQQVIDAFENSPAIGARTLTGIMEVGRSPKPEQGIGQGIGQGAGGTGRATE